jgi:hypothetical protein
MIWNFLPNYELGQDEIFCQQVNGNILLLHTKFQKNPDWHSKFMIKTILCCVLMLTNCHKLPVRNASESRHCELSCSSLFHFCKASTPQILYQESNMLQKLHNLDIQLEENTKTINYGFKLMAITKMLYMHIT